MEQIIRDSQIKLLSVFAKATKTFALAGGTALELYYLKHRFSRDLDFFSTTFNLDEIEKIICAFSKELKKPIKLENKLTRPDQAKVHFYAIPLGKINLKIDFIEDLLFKKPAIRTFNKIPVYDVKNIYFQKIIAITGSKIRTNEIGMDQIEGRNKARDLFDIYFLSQKIHPLHLFLKTLSREYQRGMVLWYRTFSRQDFRLDYLDLDVYDKNLDSSQIIKTLKNEIEKFAGELR
ncbi:MAG: nucleotidyl transferase AbiEii/AbiGii toxin family protein [Elusimicrobia bacterium]|nr:nucleotidyl transferase AbiEii/AbiGii toxin family protein [Elusimicrobiota bacterium]